MSGNYDVTLTPLPEEDPIILTFEDVELGFNSLGWLVFADSRRETVAAFVPGSVMYAIRSEESDPSSLITTLEDEEGSVN